MIEYWPSAPLWDHSRIGQRLEVYTGGDQSTPFPLSLKRGCVPVFLAVRSCNIRLPRLLQAASRKPIAVRNEAYFGGKASLVA